MIGVLAALGSACLWAVTTMLVKLAAGRLSVVAINAYRTIVGALLLVAIFLATHDPRLLLSLPPLAVAALLVSVVGGMAFGDTLNFRAMQLIGLGRSFPIAGSFPLFTIFFAWLLVGEVVGPREVGGCLVTLLGVMLVALPDKAAAGPAIDGRTNLLGVLLALGAAVLWAFSSAIIPIGLAAMDVLTANAIRLPVAALVLLLLLRREPPQPALWQLRGRTLAIVVAAGLLGSGLSGYLWMVGVQEIGPARSAILSATSPIFAVPLSLLVLKERLTRRVLLGTLISVAGVATIVGGR